MDLIIKNVEHGDSNTTTASAFWNTPTKKMIL